MNEQSIIELMESSKSETEWNANCDAVKAACKNEEYAGELGQYAREE